jgi:hypothetical protein
VNFREIDKVRRLFGLGESATLKEIKTAYRRLAHHNPVKCSWITAINADTTSGRMTF